MTTVPRTLAFITLGCPKNTVDSEHMIGLLVQEVQAISAGSTGRTARILAGAVMRSPERRRAIAP